MKATRFLGFGGPVVVSAIVLNMVAAHASFTYSGQGYDVSYPQCPPNGYTVPPGSSFGIIGANSGRPFTLNPCFGTEYSSPANSAYVNTGYAKAYRSNITATCSQASGGDQAWAIGCSEAQYSVNGVAVTPSMWWLDVETANSWSSGNVAPNRSAIQGVISELAATGLPVGVYSTASAWSRITGRNFVPSGVAGVWVPAPQCSGTTSFITGAPVLLTQKIVNNLDVDTAC